MAVAKSPSARISPDPVQLARPGRDLLARLLPIAIHAALLLALLAIEAYFDDPIITLRWGGYVSCLVHLGLMVMEGRRTRIVVTPLSFYFFWYAMAAGAAAVFVASQMERSRFFWFSTARLEAHDLADGYVLCVIGGLCLHAGMQLVRPVDGERRNVSPPRAPLGRWMMSGFGLTGLFFFSIASRLTVLGGYLGGAGGIMSRGSLVALSALALIVGTRRRDLAFWGLLGLGLAIEFVMALRSGSKAFVMYTFLPIIWLALVDRRLRGWMAALAPALIVFYLGLLAPVISTMRVTTAASEGSVVERIFHTFAEGDYKAQPLSENLEGLASRQFEAASVGFIVQEVNRRGFMEGETLDYLLYGFVPRIIWPNKPSVTRGHWFNEYLRQEEDAHTSIGQMATGELYWNFGTVGVCLGMTLIGLLFGGIWRLSGSEPDREPLSLLCHVSTMFLMNNMAEFGTTLMAGVYYFLFFGVLFWLTRRFGLPVAGRRLERPNFATPRLSA